MLYTISYKLKNQKGNFVKYIIPKSIDSEGKVIATGDRADALDLWEKIKALQSVNSKPVAEAALCFGGEIIFDDGVQGNAVISHYQIMRNWNEADGERIITDPEPPVVAIHYEEPEELVPEEEM